MARYRKRMSRSRSRRVFKKTAMRSHKKNNSYNHMTRGSLRF